MVFYVQLKYFKQKAYSFTISIFSVKLIQRNLQSLCHFTITQLNASLVFCLWQADFVAVFNSL